MQRMLANVGIDENEIKDALTKQTRKLDNDKLPCVVTLDDTDAATKSRLKDKAVKLKHQIFETDTSKTLANTLTGLTTRQQRGMKINRDGSTTYLHFRNYDPAVEISSEYFFSCTAILAFLQHISDCFLDFLRRFAQII